MTDVAIEKPITLDLLDTHAPALSATSDMPVIETKPDATPAKEPEAPAAPAPDKDASKTTSESATEHTDEHSGEPGEKKPPRGVQKRLDELAKREADAIRRAEAAEALARTLAEQRRPQETPPEPKAAEEQEPQRPQRASFADDASYDAAVDQYIVERAEFVANRTVKQREQERTENERRQAFEQAQRTAMESYAQRVAKAREAHSDYAEVAESPNVTVSQVMAQAIMHSEEGPELAYFLGKNPAEAERIAKLPPPTQLLELGKIAVKLNEPAPKPADPPAPAPKPVSAAPAPGKPIRASDVTVKSPQEESMEEYAARRRKELASSRQPVARH